MLHFLRAALPVRKIHRYQWGSTMKQQMHSYMDHQARASMPSQISSEPTTSIATASSITIPYMSCGMRRKRIPQRRMQRPMITSPLDRRSKRSLDMSFWHVSQEEARRCRQHKHCKQAGHTVPGIEQSSISQLSSMIRPFQKIRCFSNKLCCSS
jgi:hypothetical protein